MDVTSAFLNGVI
jgi:hypothetical protein